MGEHAANVYDVLAVSGERFKSEGALAEHGDTVTVKYKGTLEDGQCFDSGKISFTLNAGEVIKGWDRGINGMKVGGKRKLVCPPAFG